MPETLAGHEPRTLALQRALAGLVLDADGEAFGGDASGFARRRGLGELDQQAFLAFRDGLSAYRELARLSLVDPIETMFPITRALLEREGAWEPCLQAFLEARCLRSPHYRDIAPAFLGWLVESGWGLSRWPFLPELAHAEILEVLVSRFPETGLPADLRPEPRVGDRVVLHPATQVVAYGHAVHRVSEDEPVPEARPTHLLAFRGREGAFQLLELTPATAALLVRAQLGPLGDAARELGLSDLPALWVLLQDLQVQGAIAGFQAAP